MRRSCAPTFVCIRSTACVRTTPVHIHSQGKGCLVTCFGTTPGLRRYCIICGWGLFQAPSQVSCKNWRMNPRFSLSPLLFLPSQIDWYSWKTRRVLLNSQVSELLNMALCVFVFTCCQPSLIQLTHSPGDGVLPYMAYTGMCRWTGYGFCLLCPKKGI